MWKKGRPSEREALELILRYLSIDDPEKRKQLFELAEKFARESSPPLATED